MKASVNENWIVVAAAAAAAAEVTANKQKC